jgi:hypothetical protein
MGEFLYLFQYLFNKRVLIFFCFIVSFLAGIKCDCITITEILLIATIYCFLPENTSYIPSIKCFVKLQYIKSVILKFIMIFFEPDNVV